MKTLSKLALGVVAVAMFLVTQTNAQTISLVTDTFSYPDGTIPSPWTIFSGTGMNVLSGQATLTGALSGDASLPIGSTHSSDEIFAAFDLTVVSWAQSGTPSYFAMFKDASTFNFFSRTYVTNVVGGVQIGVSTSNVLPPIWSPVVTLGSTHRITIGLDQTGPTLASSLYLDGALVGTTTATNFSGYAIEQFALRQSNSTTMGNVQVDNLDVYTIPEPSTMLLVGIGLAGLLAVRRRK